MDCYNTTYNACKSYEYIPQESTTVEIENSGPKKNWIYNSNINPNWNETDYGWYARWADIWSLTTHSESSYGVYGIFMEGNTDYVPSAEEKYIRPVLYLSSSVKTTSGDGSIDSPYKLSL